MTSTHASRTIVDPTAHIAAYLDAKQVSERFRLSTSYLAKLRVYGGGPEYLKVGSRILYREDDVVRWLESHRRASTAARGAR